MELTRLDGLHILFADDRREARFVVEHLLKDAGATVDLAENGLQALNLMRVNDSTQTRPYDAVVLDILMPGLDGLGVTRRLRMRGCHVPILALSAGKMEMDRQECLDAGCDDFLSKPIDGEKLVSTLYRLVTTRSEVVS